MTHLMFEFLADSIKSQIEQHRVRRSMQGRHRFPCIHFYWVAYGQTQSRSAFCLFVFFFLVFFFFSVSVKVLPVTPLLSGVFVHRAFCEYFLRIERVVELRRFLWWTQ